MRHVFGSLLALAGLATFGNAQTNLYLSQTISLGPLGLDIFGGTSGNDAGFNPSALATDGTHAWIVGYNATNAIARTGMVRLLNAFGGAPTVQFVTNAAVTTTPTQRGYVGVVYDSVNGDVVASYDEGTATANGITAFGAFDGTIVWQANLRGSSHGAMDPGFASAGYGYAHVAFGSGRRWLYDALGNQVYGSTSGFIFYPGVGSTTNRSIAFQANGNTYVRAGNDMYKAVRSGENATSSRVLFVDLADAAAVSGQNLCIGSVGGQDVVFFNDRPVTASTQAFDSVVKAVNADSGAPLTLNFLNNGGTAPAGVAVGNGYYDMDWANDKLYVLDFLNRNIYVFSKTPGATTLVPTAFNIVEGTPFGGNVASLAASDDDKVYVLSDEVTPNATMTIDWTGAPTTPNSLGFSIEISATRNDLSTFIDVRNQSTTNFENFDFHVSSTSDVTRTFTVSSGAPNYVAAGLIQARIRWIPQADLEAADGWSEQVDQAKVDVL